jgi:adenosylcobinamide-GDP ribazoletransferase
MSKSKAIKTFRDLLSFLTIIPLGETEDFVETSARNIFLFPVIGAVIGLFAAAYFFGVYWVVLNLLNVANFVISLPNSFLQSFIPAVTTLAFLLVITGFQHFDGLVDLGNAIGLRRIEDRREIAHRWIVTYRGALLAIAIELSAILGLFFVNVGFAIRALLVAEVSAKVAMTTIVWIGHASHEGLGARFIRNAKRKLNLVGYAIAFLIGIVLLGLAGLVIVFAAILCGLLMMKVANSTFGGVSGDMIGATNETARALSLVMVPLLWFGFEFLFMGALML